MPFNRSEPVPAKMQWCTVCTKISTKDCVQKNHERCDLESEEGAMMAETHFKLHLMNCKKVWNEALKKRQEVCSRCHSFF